MAASGAEPPLTNILTLPAEKARLAVYPPTCRVLVQVPSNPASIVSGRIEKIFVDLFSALREDQYVVVADESPNMSNEQKAEKKELVVTECCLCYGPGCSVYLKSSTASMLASVPGMTIPSADGEKLEATIVSAYRMDGTWLYSAKVTTASGRAVVHHGVSQDLVSYRHVDESDSSMLTRQENADVVANANDTCASATKDASSASVSAAPSKLPSVTTRSSDDKADDDACSSITMSISGSGSRSNLKRTSSSEKEIETASSLSDVPPRAKRSKPNPERDANTVNGAVHIRRIDLPDYIGFSCVKEALIGYKGETMRLLKARLQVLFSVLHRQANNQGHHDKYFFGRNDRYGAIAPERGGPNCVMIQAPEAEKAEHVVQVIVDLVVKDCNEVESAVRLREELLESVKETTVDDPSFLSCIAALSKGKNAGSGEHDVEVRRILLPSYLHLGTIKDALIGPRSAHRDLVRKKGAKFWLYGNNKRDYTNYKTALYGELIPSYGRPCIMLRAAKEDVADGAVDMMIDIICELFPDKEQLQQDLRTSIAGTTVEDRGFIDPSTMNDGSSDDSSVESNANEIDLQYTYNTNDLASSDDEDKKRGGKQTRKIHVPEWMNPRTTAQRFIGGGGSKIQRLESETRCRIHVLGKGTADPRIKHCDNLCIAFTGRSDSAFEEARLLIEDALLGTVGECEENRLLYDLEVDRKYDMQSASLMSEVGPTVRQRSSRHSHRDFVWMNCVPLSGNYQQATSIATCLIGNGGRDVRRIASKSKCRIQVMGIPGQSQDSSKCHPYVFLSDVKSKDSVENGIKLLRDCIEGYYSLPHADRSPPPKASRPNIPSASTTNSVPAKLPAPTIDSALSSKR